MSRHWSCFQGVIDGNLSFDFKIRRRPASGCGYRIFHQLAGRPYAVPPVLSQKIGKWRLPFTPGIIPKRKGALAKAVGKAVGEQLFTKEDFASVISSDAAKQNVADIAVNFWKSAGEKTAAQLLDEYIPDEREKLIKSAEGFLSDRIYSAVGGMNLGTVVAEEGAKAISKKKARSACLQWCCPTG